MGRRIENLLWHEPGNHPIAQTLAKRAKSVKKTEQSAAQPEKILFRVEGKMSTFGGPHDLGMSPDEDLALFSRLDLENPKYADLFLPASPPDTSGVGRRLNHRLVVEANV